MKIKALIIIPQYFPYGGAVANIINNIVSHRNEVYYDILTFGDATSNKCEHNGYNVYTIDNKQMYRGKELLCNITTPGNFRELTKRALKKIGINSLNWIDNNIVQEISEKIISLNSKGKQYDVYIPVVANPAMYLGVKNAFMKIGKIGKIVIYQVDPIAGNLQHDPNKSLHWVKFETEMYNYADAVIVHPIQYHTSPIDKQLLKSKSEVIEWPLLYNRTSCGPKTNSPITCFFSGYLDEKIRSPQYLMRLIDRIEDSNIKFVFYSPGKKELVYKYASENAKKHIIYHDAVPFEECMEVMKNSSVLINIGNSCINQMPSKVFDYISTGKPIINLCKTVECPTINYLKSYPIALNLIENESEFEDNVKMLVKFIKEKAGFSITYTQIKELYQECQCTSVVEKMEKKLLDICSTGKSV